MTYPDPEGGERHQHQDMSSHWLKRLTPFSPPSTTARLNWSQPFSTHDFKPTGKHLIICLAVHSICVCRVSCQAFVAPPSCLAIRPHNYVLGRPSVNQESLCNPGLHTIAPFYFFLYPAPLIKFVYLMIPAIESHIPQDESCFTRMKPSKSIQTLSTASRTSLSWMLLLNTPSCLWSSWQVLWICPQRAHVSSNWKDMRPLQDLQILLRTQEPNDPKNTWARTS